MPKLATEEAGGSMPIFGDEVPLVGELRLTLCRGLI